MMLAQNLEIQIGRTAYGIELLPDAPGKTYRLTKDDGATVYDVTQGEDRTTCDCGDWRHRHADLPYSEGCKHVKALVAAGMLLNVRPRPLVQEELWEAFDRIEVAYVSLSDMGTVVAVDTAITIEYVSYADTTIGRDQIDWRVLGERHRGGESLAALGAAIGIPRQTVYRHLKRLGYK